MMLNEQLTNRIEAMSSMDGADTRIPKQRLRIAGITRDVELTHKIIRHEAIYFSIVRRNAC